MFPSQQEDVRPQDTVSVIGGVAGSSKQGRKAAWKFVKDNWEELYNRYQGGFLISRLIKVKKGPEVYSFLRFSGYFTVKYTHRHTHACLCFYVLFHNLEFVFGQATNI